MDWDSWAILFSHPKDFTPVCTTELGTWPGWSRNSEEKREMFGLSVDR